MLWVKRLIAEKFCLLDMLSTWFTFTTSEWFESYLSKEHSFMLSLNLTFSIFIKIPSFIIGDQALYWCTKTQEERKQATCEQYAKAFDSEEALYPTHYIDRNWPAEKYSGGCYVSIMPCGVLTSFGEALRAPIGRVYFAGTETATVWSGERHRG